MPKKKITKKKGVSYEQELIFKDIKDQEYVLITKSLGNSRYLCVDPNGKEYLAHRRGSLRKKEIRQDDYCIVSFRDFCDKKVDIIHIYAKKHFPVIKRFFKSNDIFEEEIIFENEENTDKNEIVDDEFLKNI